MGPRVYNALTLEELGQVKNEYQARLKAAQAEVEELEPLQLSAIMNGNADDHREKLKAAQNRVNDANLVLAEVARNMPAAKALALRQRAKGLKVEAAQADTDAAEIEARIEPLLQQIEELQGVRYTTPPLSQFGRGANQARSQMLRQRAFRLREQAEDLIISADRTQSQGTPQWEV